MTNTFNINSSTMPVIPLESDKITMGKSFQDIQITSGYGIAYISIYLDR